MTRPRRPLADIGLPDRVRHRGRLGRDALRQLQRAYDAALAGGYLWHEFGNLHLVLPD